MYIFSEISDRILTSFNFLRIVIFCKLTITQNDYLIKYFSIRCLVYFLFILKPLRREVTSQDGAAAPRAGKNIRAGRYLTRARELEYYVGY